MLGHLGLREVHGMAIKAIRARDGYMGEGTKGEDFIHRDDPRRDYLPVSTDPTDCFNILLGDDGEMHPGCIVGSMLIEAGVSLDHFECRESSGAGDLLDYLQNAEVIDTMTEVASRFITLIQLRQDKGFTWGSSVEFALDRIIKHEALGPDDRDFLIELGHEL